MLQIVYRMILTMLNYLEENYQHIDFKETNLDGTVEHHKSLLFVHLPRHSKHDYLSYYQALTHYKPGADFPTTIVVVLLAASRSPQRIICHIFDLVQVLHQMLYLMQASDFIRAWNLPWEWLGKFSDQEWNPAYGNESTWSCHWPADQHKERHMLSMSLLCDCFWKPLFRDLTNKW